MKIILFILIALSIKLNLFCQTKFNPYVPAVPVNEYRDAELYKQKVYDQRRQYISEQNDKLGDLLTKINDLATTTGQKWINDYNAWADKYTNQKNYDITNIDVYNYLVSTYRTWIRDAQQLIKKLTDNQ